MILSLAGPKGALNTKYVRSWSILHQRDLRLVTLCGSARLARHRHGLVARRHRIERFWLPLHGHSARQKSWRLGQGRYEKFWENAPSWLVSGVVLHKGSYLIRIKILQREPPAPQSGCIKVTASYSWPRMSLRTRSYGIATALKLQSVLGSRFHFMEWEMNKIENFLLSVSVRQATLNM